MPDVYSPIQAQMSVAAAEEILGDYVTDLEGRLNDQLLLYQNNVAPSPTNTLAVFQIATFGGYVSKAISSWTATAVDPQNNAYVTSALLDFACNGTAPSNQIFGSLHVATPAGGLQATATNTGSGGGYSPIFTIVDAGAGYTAPPPISLTGSGGTGAAAHAVLTSSGGIASIVLDSAGTGYSAYPVVIGPPLELIKQNVLSTTGISMSLSTDAIQTFTQLIQPAAAL